MHSKNLFKDSFLYSSSILSKSQRQKQIDTVRGKKENKESNDREGRRDERGETAKSDLAESRRAGRELSDLHRLIVVGVVLVVCIDVMITI